MMTDKQIKEEIKHINKRNQEYIAENNRMTDKQIMIDGVDVSGCKNLMQGIVPFGCMEDRKTCSCMKNPNCLYKQLARKEQECEKLKQTLIEIKEIAGKQCVCGVDCMDMKQILQKISEIDI